MAGRGISMDVDQQPNGHYEVRVFDSDHENPGYTAFNGVPTIAQALELTAKWLGEK